MAFPPEKLPNLPISTDGRKGIAGAMDFLHVIEFRLHFLSHHGCCGTFVGSNVRETKVKNTTNIYKRDPLHVHSICINWAESPDMIDRASMLQ